MVQEGKGSTNQSAGTLVIKIAILTFTKMWKMSAIYNQVDNTTALNYLLIMRRTKNLKAIQVSKEIWEFPFG